MAEEITESQKKLEESRRELAEKNERIQSFFRKMRKRLVEVGSASIESAKAVGSYLRTLENVATASVQVGAEMASRGLGDVKKNIDSRIESISESARRSVDAVVEDARSKVAATKDNVSEGVRKRKSAADRVGKKADKATERVEHTSEVKSRRAQRHSNTKRNKGTIGAAIYSKVERVATSARKAAAKRTISRAKILGKGIAFVRPDSKLASQVVESAEKSSVQYVRRDSKLESSVKGAVARVHDAEDGVRTTKRTVKRDKDNLERARKKEEQEITAGKRDREGASRFTRDVTRGIRLASLAKSNLRARTSITISGFKAGIDRLFGRKSEARDTQVAAYRDAKESLREDSSLAEAFDSSAEKVEEVVSSVSSRARSVGRTVTNGITVAIGGIATGVSDVGKRAIAGAKTVEEGVKLKAQEVEEGVRSARKFLVSAPDRIETASRKGISELLNNMASHTKSLADKISPKTHDDGERRVDASLDMSRA